MRNGWMAALICVGSLALAASPPEPGAEDNVAEYIFHHVADGSEYELEIPLNTAGGNPVIHLPEIRIPLVEGGCPADRHAPVSFTQCLDLSITKHTVMMWLAAGLLILAFLWMRGNVRGRMVPRGAGGNLLETLVQFVRDEIAIKNIGPEHGPRYTPYLLTAFFFILFMNLLGLIPYMATATSNLAVTAALAGCTFVVTQYAAIRTAGLKTYLAHLTAGVHWLLWPIMIPVEILGLFTKPFALTIRLFANMLAGHIILFFLISLIFIMDSVALAPVAVGMAVAIYLLEIFVSFVQAFIFTMLSALFIGMGVAMAHHGHEHHEEKGPGHPEPALAHGSEVHPLGH